MKTYLWLVVVVVSSSCCGVLTPGAAAQGMVTGSGDGNETMNGSSTDTTGTNIATTPTSSSSSSSSSSSPSASLMNFTMSTAYVQAQSVTMGSASTVAGTTVPQSQPSLLQSLAVRVATSSCVRYNVSNGFTAQQFVDQAKTLCPTYASRYLSAEGVSVFSIDGQPNATAFARLLATTLYYRGTFGDQLAYYSGPARENLLHGLAAVQWDHSTVEDMEKRVDLLTCTSLYPPCEVIDGRLLALQACDWFCEDLRQALLPLAEALATDRSALLSSGYYALLYATSHSCISNNAVTSNAPAARGTAASASPPRCQNCSKTACSKTKVTAMVAGSKESTAPPGRLCFNTSTLTPCPSPFLSTPIAEHWDSTVQSNLLGVVAIARAMLRVNTSFLPANGSFLPCTFDCRDSLFFTKTERDAVVLVLGIISLFVVLVGIFALGSFALNWRRLNNYPQRLILIVNVNVFISVFGICGQFLTNDPDSFLCNADGSVRKDVPDGTPSGAACTILFTILYFFSMASVAWWVCLSHAWYVTLPCVRQPDFGRERNRKYEKWYHVFTWPTVAILTIVQLATREVGGVHFYGICWMDNDLARFGYLVVPLCVASMFGSVFLFLGIRSFYKSRSSLRMSMLNVSQGSSTKGRSRKSKVERAMQLLLVRLWILLIAVLFHMVVQITIGSIRRAKWDEWTQLTRTRLSCLLTTCNDAESCPPLPSVSVVLLALSPIASGTYALATYIWAFSGDNFRLWKKFFQRLRRRAPFLSETEASYRVTQLSSDVVVNGVKGNGDLPLHGEKASYEMSTSVP